MGLYLKILRFITPYWKAILISLSMTLLYVFFNNLSLWISVDFVQELFAADYSSQTIEKSTENVPTKPDKESRLDQLFDTSKDFDLYNTINYNIKRFLIQDTQAGTLKMLCLVIFLSFLLKNIVDYLRKVILSFVEIRVIMNIRNRLHEKIMHLPISIFDKRHSGEMTSIVFNDVSAINNVFHTSFGPMILTPVQIVTNIVILFLIDVKLTLITFLVLPLSVTAIVKIGQGMRRRSRRVFKRIAEVLQTFQEAVSAIRIVKAFSNEDKEIDKFHQATFKHYKNLFRANRLKFATSPINEVLLVLILVLLLWYGGNMVFNNTGLKAEDFVRFLLFLFTMFQPIKAFSGINNTMQTGMAAAERVFNIIETEPEKYDPEDAADIKEFKDKIEFKNVKFRYSDETEYILDDINLTIKRGEMVAFVGHSGSGKTTLINLVPRLYEVAEGSILIDGIDIRKLKLKSLRRLMGIVTQESVLFNDTVRTNIAYGLDEVAEQDIIEASRSANALEFIEKMDQGFDTHIGERGVRLSGGQKQRLSIARAILKNPPILILDEATSSLDTESERLVQEAIDKLLLSRTVLVIAHRLSTIKNATKIVVLNDSRIESIGTHEELYTRSPVYKNLYDNQLLDNGSA
ncbi:MAG: ABC transporter ATP-binding protein [Calditrichaceae bacterium]